MKLRLLALLVIPLWLWSAPTITDEAQWERYMLAGKAAYQRGDYETAVQETLRALGEAEAFGEQDARFATTLNNVAEFYRIQGRYAEAEPLYKRSLQFGRRCLGRSIRT